ncbi:MAG: glycosyltransferase family 4 protein [Nitritalea sp.]
MNICLVSREFGNSQRGGGIGAYIKEIGGLFVDLGHRVHVITAHDDTRLEEEKTVDGMHVHFLSGADFVIPAVEPGNTLYKKLRTLTRFHAFRKKIRDKIQSIPDLDVIEVQEYGAEALYLEDIGIPVVIRFQTPTLLDRDTFLPRKNLYQKPHEWMMAHYEQASIRKFAYFTSASQSLLDWMETHFDLRHAKQKVVIFNPIRLENWRPRPLEGENTPFRLIFAGTLVETKGIGELVEALRILRKENRAVQLDIAGKQSPYSQALQASLSTEDRQQVRFVGQLTRPELNAYYAACDAAVFPSWWDNLPLVCVEAMYANGAVIGSNAGGMAELIEHGKNGWLVPPKNPQALADCIRQLLALPVAERARVREKARRDVHEKFSNLPAQQTVDFYKQVCYDWKKTRTLG